MILKINTIIASVLVIGIIAAGLITAISDRQEISAGGINYETQTTQSSAMTSESTPEEPATTDDKPIITSNTPVTSAANPVTSPANPVTTATQSVQNYNIKTELYKSNNIVISYPKLENFNNIEKINKLIYNDIVPDILVDYKEYSETIDFELNYEIKLMNGEILSIVYTGLAYDSKWAYPHNLFYATSINLQTGTKIKLPDIINLNNEFADIYKSVASENELTISEAYKVIGENSNEELLRIFNGDYPYSDSIIYFTEDFLGISIGVPHACGDHLECEIKYSSISDFFINDFSVN